MHSFWAITALSQRLADVDSEAADARALATVVAPNIVNDASAVVDLQLQLQALQERFVKAELARVKDAHSAAVEHSEQLHRLHHKLAATEMQVRGIAAPLLPISFLANA